MALVCDECGEGYRLVNRGSSRAKCGESTDSASMLWLSLKSPFSKCSQQSCHQHP
jgi:hypothetical protein